MEQVSGKQKKWKKKLFVLMLWALKEIIATLVFLPIINLIFHQNTFIQNKPEWFDFLKRGKCCFSLKPLFCLTGDEFGVPWGQGVWLAGSYLCQEPSLSWCGRLYKIWSRLVWWFAHERGTSVQTVCFIYTVSFDLHL